MISILYTTASIVSSDKVSTLIFNLNNLQLCSGWMAIDQDSA